MSCRCPVCDQVLIVSGEITPRTVICCDRCDRGFAPQHSLCETCSASNPFERFDALTFTCASCGTAQQDLHARMTA